MRQLERHGVRLELVEGDITRQDDIDAIINAANAELQTGGGVAGAIHRAAGPGLQMEATPKAPIEPGQAVITSGHLLPNSHVIHCLGPVYGRDRPSDQLLASCYREALRIAEEHGLESVAFPALSTGAFGYPMGEAAAVAMAAVLERMPGLRSVKLIRFVLFDEAALESHRAALQGLLDGATTGRTLDGDA